MGCSPRDGSEAHTLMCMCVCVCVYEYFIIGLYLQPKGIYVLTWKSHRDRRVDLV